MLAHRISQQGTTKLRWKREGWRKLTVTVPISTVLETSRTIDYDLQHLENGCGQDGYKAAATDRDGRTPVICSARGTCGVIQDAVLAAGAKARGSRRNSRISRAD